MEKGVYQYEGPIYQLVEGYSVSKSELEKSPLPGHLRKVHAKVEILFNCKPYPTVDVPFAVMFQFRKAHSTSIPGRSEETASPAWVPLVSI